MLLNFAIDDGVINAQQKFKGGKWKDRMVAKKIATQRRNKTKTSSPVVENGQGGDASGKREARNPNRVEVGPRATKRQKVDGEEFKPSSSRSTAAGGAHEQHQQHQQQPGTKPQGQQRQIISSLFSYNPSATSTADASTQKEDEAGMLKASNAALVDGIDSFTTLGISPILAAHLLTKLDLKAPTAIQKAALPRLLSETCDGFIQAETGSGKTLAYLLPLVQRLMSVSGTGVHRDSGLFAIVLAPTRELCRQISVVLEGLLRCAHWIVSGTVIGGEKKKSEKARLRKGLNILVATPGRLADHLDNTKVLDVSNVRWLVLDEGDRLMELGFEEELQGIIRKLDERQKPTQQLAGLPEKRTTILCSATLKMNVQRLGEISLADAVHIKADPSDEGKSPNANDDADETEFSVPAQLRQSYLVVPAKLRLVTLTALLKRTFARKGTVMKAVVFVSCADSVDFHFELFTRRRPGDAEEKSNDEADHNTTNAALSKDTVRKVTAFSNPSTSVVLHKLHGSLPQHVRTATLSEFARQKDPSVLVCTDVASRGLDLPNVDLVVEYDPAFSADDHLHRIGRTARLGREGRALIFLLPGLEEGYVDILKRAYRDGSAQAVSRNDPDEILKRGFGGNSDEASKGWEEKATDCQLETERWTIENPTKLEMARRAYQSHIRAYATHVANERSIFSIKELHLGHLAKSFGLRDRPAKINVPGLRPGKEETKQSFKADRKKLPAENNARRKGDSSRDDTSQNMDSGDAARKMQAKVKAMMGGASEFNIA